MIDGTIERGLKTLSALIGAENVRADDEACGRAGSSWSPLLAKAKAAGTASVPWAVVFPADTEEVAALVRWANETGTPLYAVGGGSNRVGSTEPLETRQGVAVDLSRLQSIDWDEESLLVNAGAGWVIGELETRLSEHDYTLGQLPQSMNLLTVGGAIAVDATGTFSGKYGRQSNATLSLTAVLPTGTVIKTQSSPLGSPYFDLSGLLVGTEGVFGIVTEATLRMHPVPEARAWSAFTFPSFDEGIDALRLVYRSDARPTAARLLDPATTADLLAHYPQAIDARAAGTVLLLLGFEGDEIVQTGNFQLAFAICQQVGGVAQDTEIGERWLEEYRTSSLGMAANARPGGLSDVFALSATYGNLKTAATAVRRAIAPYVISQSAQIVAGYENGAAIEIAFEAQGDGGADAAVLLYNRIVDAGLDAALASGAAVAHHYGVGRTRRKHFLAERGPEYVDVLRALKRTLDPNNILHPGRI